ncbi:MAG: hypothetical protein IKQ73_02230 [Oscillospiraceae bacterium]|nr:hypothetical protein [Oscillospiraceae bacterium]
MPDSKSVIDLTRIPFGGPHCGVLVYEENNCDGTDIKPGLYLAARIHGGEHRREGGIVDIVPIVDGEPVSYTYEATPTTLKLTAAEGGVTLIIDSDSTARLFGHGVGIKLYAKFPFYSMMNASILPGDLLDLSLGGTQMNGGRYLMKPLKGRPVCHSVFNPSTNGPDDARVELLPDDSGDIDFEIYTMNPDEWGYIDTVPAEDAVCAAEKRFAEYKAKYPEFPEKYACLRDPAVYAVWIHRENPNTIDFYPTMKDEVIYTGRLSRGWANAYEQPLHAMAFADTGEELRLIRAMFNSMANGMLPGTLSTTKVYYQAGPPTQGAAVLDLLRKTGGKLDADKAADLYGLMKENYGWWKASHSFGEHRFSYNHRDELCLPGASYNALEFPLETPDLYALMILYAEALGQLAAIAGEDGGCWKTEAEGLLETLKGLWNGASFDCRSVRSGKRTASDSLLARVPVILGCRLDEEMLKALCADLGDEKKFFAEAGFATESMAGDMYAPAVEGRGAVVMWLNELVINGLFDAGCTELAKKAAGRVLDFAKAGGAASVISTGTEPYVFRPGGAVNAVTGSALICLAGRL